MLNYKKPAFRIIVVTGVVCILAAVYFLMNPGGLKPDFTDNPIVSAQRDAFPAEVKKLSPDDVIILSQKGNDLTWHDFDGFAYTEGITGMYSRVYEINEIFSLILAGSRDDEKPQYIRLNAGSIPGNFIDIRSENVAEFINSHRLGALPLSFGSADPDRDGEDESFEVSETYAGVYTLKVIKSDGSVLWSEDAAAAHAGWNGLFLYSGDDGFYLLRYNPTMFQGRANYHYELFTLEGGTENVIKSRAVDFSANPDDLPTPEKQIEMDSFAAEVNSLLEKSVVLLSTTKDGELVYGGVSADAFSEKYTVLENDVYYPDDAVSVTSNGETVTPYKNHLWVKTWHEGNWLMGDGMSVSYTLPEIYTELPTLTLSSGIVFNAGQAGKLIYISVFDGSYERIIHNEPFMSVQSLSEGTYYVSAVVSEQGAYIAEAEDYEADGYEYVFRLIVP